MKSAERKGWFSQPERKPTNEGALIGAELDLTMAKAEYELLRKNLQTAKNVKEKERILKKMEYLSDAVAAADETKMEAMDAIRHDLEKKHVEHFKNPSEKERNKIN